MSVILIKSEEKIKAIFMSFVFSLFSVFPLVFMVNDNFNFFLEFIKYAFSIIIFLNILALISKKVTFSFFAIASNFLFLALSCLASTLLAATINSAFYLFLFFILVYIVLYACDIYLLYKNNYFFNYKKVFLKNVVNEHYSFNGFNEFEQLKEYRADTKIPKIQIIYLILLPVIFIFKGAIFKVSSEYSNLSSNLGTSVILSFCFVYIFGVAIIFVQDTLLKWYFSINYKD